MSTNGVDPVMEHGQQCMGVNLTIKTYQLSQDPVAYQTAIMVILINPKITNAFQRPCENGPR